MCGICGFYSKNEYKTDVLTVMNDSIRYRGPDDSGVVLYDEDGGSHIGLAHRRLSIMDLSEKGHQPMFSDDGQVTLIYNGEIYNFLEIREELEKEGIIFTTRCDTEVVLKSYLQYGCECFGRFNGMFALAVYDRRKHWLILARDRMGVKPLYYYHNGTDLVWGSELKPIMLFPGFHKDIRTDILARYFCFNYINSPDTVFENTYKVKPGEFIVYDGETLKQNIYWDIIDKYKEGTWNQYNDYVAAKERTRALIEDSVNRRMVADVPVGVFLSGGIDSTVIAALAQRSSDTPVRSYTIGFETTEENEAAYAKEVAAFLGTDHTELYIGESDLLELISDMPLYYDEPFADSSQLPTMLVSKLARKDVSVVLSGDGGDELYCGYPMYDWLYMGQRLDGFAAMAHIIGMDGWGCRLPNIVRSYISNRDPVFKAQFIETAKADAMKRMLINPYSEPKYDMEDDAGSKNWQIRRMLLDMRSYLPDEILCKTDRATMKYSLEARNPLVDYRLVEDSFRIPHKYKYHRRDKKHILKDIAYDLVPRELMDRPKQGFGVPLTMWLRTYLNEELRSYIDRDHLIKQGLFDPDAVSDLYDGLMNTDKTIYSTLLWAFYVFEKWYGMYIE